MSDRERVLAFLRSISPSAATCEEIADGSDIKSHQLVLAITEELLRQNVISAGRRGTQRRFRWIGAQRLDTHASGSVRRRFRTITAADRSATVFKKAAQSAMSDHYGKQIVLQSAPGIPTRFDFVSKDGRIVGDAKFIKTARGQHSSPENFSAIAEHVWLLERARAEKRFLIFGGDRQAPERWLDRYGALVRSVEFFFLDEQGTLDLLHEIKRDLSQPVIRWRSRPNLRTKPT